MIHHLHVFLKASNSELGPYIGDLLREVFSGGPSITLAVKEEHIYSIMNLVFLNRGEKCTSVNMSIINALFELLLVSIEIKMCRDSIISQCLHNFPNCIAPF